jgi:hypothetical protein
MASIKSLEPGDAVLTRGHVTIFGGWKNKSRRAYWALEQTTWGSHAKKRVKRIPRGVKALRRKNLTAPKKMAVAKPTPKPTTTSVVAPGTGAQ